MPNRIESVRIEGFLSLADVEIENLPRAAVLIGPNGSGKSNFIRFFEMMSGMMGSHRLAEFIALHGGAEDQLFGGGKETGTIEARLALRTGDGGHDYRFSLAYAAVNSFVFNEEAFRFSREEWKTEAE